MAKRICRNCGNAYDVDRWVECPHCARKEFERRKGNYPYGDRRIIWKQ